MSAHVRITRHPNDPAYVLIHAAPNLAQIMGGYMPARWSQTDRAFVLPDASVDQLGAYLRHHAVTVLDDRGAPPSAKRSGPLPECVHCATPAHPDRQPAFCPMCGRPWQPTVRPTRPADLRATRRCPRCGRQQPTGGVVCVDCGRPFADDEAAKPSPSPMMQTTIDDALPTINDEL